MHTCWPYSREHKDHRLPAAIQLHSHFSRRHLRHARTDPSPVFVSTRSRGNRRFLTVSRSATGHPTAKATVPHAYDLQNLLTSSMRPPHFIARTRFDIHTTTTTTNNPCVYALRTYLRPDPSSLVDRARLTSRPPTNACGCDRRE